MKIDGTPKDLIKGDHFIWQNFPFEVIEANESRHGWYVLAMRLQPQGLRIPDDAPLEIERKP